MKKKTPKYYVAQLGGRYNPSRLNLNNIPMASDWEDTPNIRKMTPQELFIARQQGAGTPNAPDWQDIPGITNLNEQGAGTPEAPDWQDIPGITRMPRDPRGVQPNVQLADTTGTIDTTKALGTQQPVEEVTYEKTGQLLESPYFKALNAGLVGASGIVNEVNSKKAADKELEQYLRAINPVAYSNMDRYGTNRNPAYTKWGGSAKYQVGGNAKTTENKTEQAAVQAASGNPEAPVQAVQPLTAKQIRNKYKDNPYVRDGRETWAQSLDKEFPLSGGRVKDTLYNVSKQANINPGLLYSSAMEEGLNLALAKPDDASEAYVDWSEKNADKAQQFPIDGFYNYGLDRFTEQYKGLQKKGYLPADFDKRFTTFEAANEKNEQIKTAAFDSDEAALMAKAAVIRDTRDQVSGFLKKRNLNVSDKALDFFTLAGYNGGLGNAQKMIDSYNQKGYLKDDNFLNPTFKPASYGSIYTNVQRRLQNADVLQNEGFFSDFTTMKTGGKNFSSGANYKKWLAYGHATGVFEDTPGHQDVSIKGKTKNVKHAQNGGDIAEVTGLPSNAKGIANVEAERGEAFTDQFGNVLKVADDEATHEQGGVMLAGVDRVLENTSTMRNDKASKYLKLEPQQIKAITGLDTRSSMSHAEALVKADEQNEKLRQDIVKKVELASKGKQSVDKYAENSVKLNLDHFKAIPTVNDLFDRLFVHQELVKAETGIPTGEEAKTGGKYIYKSGGDYQVGGYAGRRTTARRTTQQPPLTPEQKENKIEVTEWTDANLPTQPGQLQTPQQELDTTIRNNVNTQPQPTSRFNEPLRWYDVASPIGTFLASERVAEKYNPVEFNQLQYKLQDPTAALEQNQADFNAAVQTIQNTSPGNAGVQMANIANLASRKYSFNNQVLGNYENQNAQIKNQEILYNTQVRDKQAIANQQAREVFEDKVLTSKAIQQEQKLTALDTLYKTIADNKALNRNGNLMMKFSKAFDQYGEYNGYKTKFQVNPQLGINPATTTKKGEAAGGIQGLEPGKNYYNRKTGKTLYFDGVNLIQR